MRTTRSVSATAAVLALVAASAGCQAQDRAGGTAASAAETVTLTFAQPNGEPPRPVRLWVDKVEEASKGKLRIKLLNDHHRGDAAAETKTVADVRSGKVDAGWVGARAFDQLGMNTFQPLLAPLLVDSYDLEAEVFDAGIPDEMLNGLASLELHGVGVLPGPMRKVLSKGAPLTDPGAFRGLDVGIQASAVAERTFAAMGATTTALPSGADISGVDAYEQQMDSIEGNHYEDKGATSVTGNLNVWPRPLVLFAGEAAWADLSADQQDLLTTAAHDVVDPSLDAARTDDASAAERECGFGLPLTQATEQQLTEFRTAVQPVYETIGADTRNKTWLDQIASIKAELGAPPAAVSCPPARTGNAAPTSIEGTYEWTLTPKEWGNCPGDVGTNTYQLVLEDGTATIWQTGDATNGNRDIGFKSAYSVYRDTLELTAPDLRLAMNWKLDGEQLVLSGMHGGECGDQVVWTSTPMTREP